MSLNLWWPARHAHSSFRSSAAAELRAMSHAAFMDVARAMYRSLLNCIEGLYRENAIIVEVVQGIQYVCSSKAL